MKPLHEKYPKQAKKAFSNPESYNELHKFLGLAGVYKIGIDTVQWHLEEIIAYKPQPVCIDFTITV